MNNSNIHFNDPIFFDLETSGLDWNKHEIIQIAAIHPQSGDTFEAKIKFNLKDADKQALKINNFNRKEWKDALTQEETCYQFNKFLRNHRSITKISKQGKEYKVAMLAGYNCNAFDRYFLIEFFKKHNVFMDADYRMYDVYPLAMWLLPNLQHYNLEKTAEEFELNIEQTHEALFDTKLTIQICACLLEILNNANCEDFPLPRWAIKTLEKIDENNI